MELLCADVTRHSQISQIPSSSEGTRDSHQPIKSSKDQAPPRCAWWETKRPAGGGCVKSKDIHSSEKRFFSRLGLDSCGRSRFTAEKDQQTSPV